MSWSDTCGVCNMHRADCSCEYWDDVDGKYTLGFLKTHQEEQKKHPIFERRWNELEIKIVDLKKYLTKRKITF